MHDGALEATTALVEVSDGELDAARAGELITQVTTSYAKQNVTALQAANALTGAVQNSTGSWQDLYLSFKQVLPLFGDMGVPLTQAAAAMAIMWQEGIRGETAGTSVRNALLKMINPTKEVSLVMLRYGVRLFDTNGKALDLYSIMGQLENAFGENAIATGKITKQQSELALASLGLSRSMLAVLVLTKAGTGGLTEFTKKIDATDVLKLARDLNYTFLDQMGIVLNQLKAFANTFTENFIFKMTDGVYAVNQFLRSVVSLDAIAGFAKIVGNAVSGLGELKDALIGTAAVQNIFKTFGATFTAAWAIAKNLGDTLAAIWNHPGLRKYIGSILDGFNKLLGVTTDLSQSGFGKLLIAVVAVSEAIKTGVVEALDAIPYEQIASGVTAAFDRVTVFFQKDVVDLFRSWSAAAADFWNSLPRLAQEGVNNIIPFIEGIIQGIQDAITGAYTAAVAFATGIVASVSDTIMNTFGGIITGVSAAVEGVYSIVAGVANDVYKVWQQAFMNIMEGIQPLVDAFNEALPGAAQVLITAAKAAIVVGIVAYKIYQGFSEKQAANNKTLVDYLAGLWNKYGGFFKTLWDSIGKLFATKWQEFIDNSVLFFSFLGEALRINNQSWMDYWRNIASAAQTAILWIIEKLTGFFDWLEQQPIIGEKVKEVRKMFSDAAVSVDEFFAKVGALPGQVIEGVKTTFGSISGTVDDIIGGIGDQISAAFGGIGVNIADIFAQAQAAVAGMVPNVGGAVASVQAFIQRMMDAARASVGRTQADIERLLKSVREAAATTGTITLAPTGGKKPDVAAAEPGDLLTAKAENFKWIKSLLQDIPLMTDEFAKFVAEIAEADPQRLQPIVAFMHTQAGVLREIGESLQRQLAIEIKIAEVDAQLEKLALQRKAIELARESALLPFEIRIAELAQKKIALDMQALPIEQKIAAIDREIALAQRENLDMQRQRLLVQQAMLPIQEKMAAIDVQIAAAGRVNYALERQRLQIESEMAPIQEHIEDIERRRADASRENFDLARRKVAAEGELLRTNEQLYQIDQEITRIRREDFSVTERRLRVQIDMLGTQERIADIDKRIAAAQKTNYDTVIRSLEAERSMIPLKQQMADLDKKISDARKEDFDLNDRRLRAQRDMVAGQQQLSAVERRIADAQRTNYETQRLQARLDLEALDARLAVRDIEQEISDIVDKRQQLTMRREELISQHNVDLKQRELDAVTKQLDILWAQFNFRSGAGLGSGAASLIPGITDLERQRAELESMLVGLNNNLDSIQQSQADINFQNEISTIALQLEQQEQEAILRPIQDRIDLLERQQLIERARSAEQLANLEAERQAIQDQLQPYQDILDAIDAQAQATDLATQIVVNNLMRQKAELQLLLQPYQDIIDQINRVKDITQNEQDLTIAGLQKERELLLAQLIPYQDILDSIEEQTTKTGLYNDLAVLGLERQKRAIEDLQAPHLAQLHDIELQTEATRIINETRDIGAREEIDHLQAILAPLELKRLAIVREEANAQRVRDLTINFLNEQKQKLQDLLAPYDAEILRLDQITARTTIQRDLIVNALETQKRKLEELLKPIDDARIKIDEETAALNLQKAAISATYDLQLLRLQQLVLPLEVYKNSLEAAKNAEQERLNALITRFQDAITKSGLFTAQEQTDAPRRLGWWDGEVTKVTQLRDRLNDVNVAMGGVSGAFTPITNNSPGAEAAIARLRDLFGNAGTNNTLTANANSASGAIGSANGGLIAALNNMNTPLGNAATSAGGLSTALGTIGSSTYLTNINNLKDKFTDLATAVNAAKGPDNNTGGGVRQLWKTITDWTIEFAAYGNSIDWLKNKFTGQGSLTASVDVAKDAFINMKNAINDAVSAVGTLSNASSRYFATLGASVGIGVSVFQNFRNNGANYDDAARAAYQTILDRIANRSIGYAEGGVVPGPIGQAQMAIVHGGETIIPNEPTRSAMASTIINNTSIVYNYNMSASYERYQDPVTIDQNLRSIIEMSRR
jgi:TP901 family phage tail tape measure protein